MRIISVLAALSPMTEKRKDTRLRRSHEGKNALSPSSNIEFVRKEACLLTRGAIMKSLTEQIHELSKPPEGFVLSPREFLHLGSRAAVDHFQKHWL